MARVMIQVKSAVTVFPLHVSWVNDRDQREGLHSLQISFVWLCAQCCRSPGAGQTAAVAGHEGCTPYL